MSESKKTFLIFLLFSAIFFIASVICYYYDKEFAENIFIGLFSSSVLVCASSYISYCDRRKTDVEQLIDEIDSYNNLCQQFELQTEMSERIACIKMLGAYNTYHLDQIYSDMNFFSRKNQKFIYHEIYTPVRKIQIKMSEICNKIYFHQSNNAPVSVFQYDVKQAEEILVSIKTTTQERNSSKKICTVIEKEVLNDYKFKRLCKIEDPFRFKRDTR